MKAVLTFPAGLLAIGLLSNCSPISFQNIGSLESAISPVTPTPSASEASVSKISDTVVRTKMNVPITFNALLSSDASNDRFIASDMNGGKALNTANGKLSIIDAKNLQITYVPALNFRGEDSATIYLIQQNGKTISTAKVRIQVDNAIINLQPAVAVRATGCIMCHGSIASTVITDFGYGDPWFWGGAKLAPVDHTSIYADESTDPAWKYIQQLGGQVIVPHADTSSLTKVGAPTLAAYIKGVLSASGIASVQATKVVEANSVYIGAPTAARILETAHMQTGVDTIRYFPDAGQSSALPSIQHIVTATSNYYLVDGSTPFACSGDLVVDGVVYLNRAVIQSQTGCRIYATQSVFITGPLTYSGGNTATQNIQISSARAINMGLGKNTCGAAEINGNSLTHRLQEDDRRQYFFTRGEPLKTVQQKLDDIMSDANQIGVDNFLDAACEPQYGRAVTFEHIILNAPIVFSRYQGGFDGSIIAEVALMSLESFVFQFDPVFATQAVLPLLSPSDYLNVQ